MSNVSKRKKEGSRTKIKSMGDHKEFLKRITKTLYYGQLPTLPCLSLPVTEISCEVWSGAQRGRSVRRLHADAAARLARQACVSPCALVLALLYLERLNACNPDYLAAAPPQHLFLVSLMVGNKFLQDDGEDDEVICSEWAASGGIDLKQLKNLEIEFLDAIDWNVFVSEKSFETGLSWLERRVAMRQGRARGFYTYTDLCCSGSAGAGELVRGAAALGALALAYAAGVVALLAAAPLAARLWLPALQLVARARSDLLAAHSAQPLAHLSSNATVQTAVDLLADEMDVVDRLRCCAAWTRHLDETEPQRSRRDDTDATVEPWWSKTFPLEWLHRSSAVDPMRRWLERMDEYAEPAWEALDGRERRRCRSSWLDLTRLGALVATVSDR